MKDRLFNRASARRCVARLCVAVGLVIAAASHAEAGIPWHENLVAAKSASVASQRPLLVIFTAAWSEDSDRFLQTTLSSPEAVGVVCACFEAVRLDVDMNPELARRLRVTHLPTACVIDANEQLLFQFECSASSADFVAYAARAVQHAAAAKQAARPVSVPAAASAAAPLVGGPVASFNPAPTFAPAPAVSAPPQPAYTADRGFGQPTPGGATPAPGYPTYQGYAVAPPPVAPAALPTVAAVPAPGVGVSSYPTTTFPAPAVPPAAEPAAEKAPANVPTPQPVNLDPPRVAAAAPPVTPPPAAVTTMPMGMEGYCPVTLMEKGAWVEGNVQYGARHRGRTYLFAGAAEQQAFFASPDRYAPVLSGDDPVLAMDAGQRVAGDRRYGLTYESRTYLFSSPDTLNAFTAAPEVYARRVTVAENAPRLESGTILR
jgi:YHS domain-containing protein